MSTPKLLGLVLLAGGLVCLAIAHQWSESPGDQIKHFFSGDYRDETVWLAISGALASLVGAVALLTGRSRG